MINKDVNWEKYAFLSPSMVILFLGLVLPFLAVILLSFFEYSLLRTDQGISFVGIQNFVKLIQDPQLINAIGNSLIFASVVVSLELLLGSIMALLVRGKIWFETVFKSSILIPLMMVPVVGGITWRLFLLPLFSPLTQVFDFLRIPLDPSFFLTTSSGAMIAIILADVWRWTPFVFLLVLATLYSIPQKLYEAARMDGASNWQQLRFITVPMLKQTLVVIGAIRGMDAIRTFDMVYSLTGGGPGLSTELISLFNYRIAFQNYTLGYASAISTLVVMLLSVLVTTALIISRRGG